MTKFESNAYTAILSHVTESQQWCLEHHDLMTESELRQAISQANRAFGLRPALLEQIAREIEATVGVAISLA